MQSEINGQEFKTTHSRTGPSISDRIHFISVGPRALTDAEQQQIQTQMYYHPNGYGYFRGDSMTSGNETRTIWSCSASCD